MKFLHLADLHLGRSLGEFDLIEDQEYILNEILGIIREKGVDAVLIAGDVYDKSVPSEAATNLLDHFLNQLASLGTKVFLISGNHDSDDRLNFGSELFQSNGIFISSIYNGKIAKRTVSDEHGDIDVYMLPFVKASQVHHFYPEETIESYEDAVRVALSKSGLDPARRNLLLAHQFVAGKGADPALGGSEGVAAQSVGTVEKIGYGVFDGFDYVALGHIHSPQRVGREEVRYAGSPLKYSLSEVDNEKSVPIVTVGEKGSVEIELAPLTPRRNLRHIKGPMKELLAKEHVVDADDFIYATLTDEDYVDDVMGIFQMTYPNTVKIDYDNSHTRKSEQVDIAAITEEISFPELVGDFFKLVYGEEISEEEMDVMRMVAKEAGIIDETD